ncbi:MAG: twin transmembrane helix small protein [Sinimarinibacterium flocculans]|uniref:twin transmembrane helix small protein n=1 Tax=Sinimarinibacterium flocculans TaxID=985250 RepID=UPI003C6760BF
MLVKIIIVGLLLAIVASLFTSMSFLIRDDSERRRTLTALKIRIALSITLVLFVLLSWHMGWIAPHTAMRTPIPSP